LLFGKRGRGGEKPLTARAPMKEEASRKRRNKRKVKRPPTKPHGECMCGGRGKRDAEKEWRLRQEGGLG